MQPVKITVKDHVGREVNPHHPDIKVDFMPDRYEGNLEWFKFEKSVKSFPCPELANTKPGETVDAELVWQENWAVEKGDSPYWVNVKTPNNAYETRQIWRLVKEEKEPELKPYFAQVNGDLETEVYASNIYEAFTFILKEYKEKFHRDEFDGYDISCRVWCSYSDQS